MAEVGEGENLKGFSSCRNSRCSLTHAWLVHRKDNDRLTLASRKSPLITFKSM